MTVRLIQITNVSTSCQKDQLRSLFANLGRIEDLQLYPDSETLAANVGAKVAYIKFEKTEFAHAALQLTNTVFIERALICSLVRHGKIPDETEAVKYCAPLNPNVMLIPGGGTWPNTVINRVVGTGPSSVIETYDPALAERSLPQYPPLPGSMDPIKAEEIRRTVYVSNIANHVSLENLNDLFSQIGEVRFIRFAGDENAPFKAAYIEFSDQPSICKALCLNGLSFGGNTIKVNHSTASIIKPATNKMLYVDLTKKRSPSRTRKSKSPSSSKQSKKHTSRSPRHSSRSRKRSRSKKRSRSPRKHSRSSKKRSKSKDAEKKRRSSSKSKKRSRSRKRSRSKETKKRRSRSRGGGGTSSSVSKSGKSSHHRSRSHKRSSSRSKANASSSSSSKHTRNRSKSDDKRRSSKEKKTSKRRSKSKERNRHNSPSSSSKRHSGKDEKHSGGDKAPSQVIKRDYDDEEKSIEKMEYSSQADQALYGPKPPPSSESHEIKEENDQANVQSSSSDDSSSSSNDEDDDENNMEAE